jgi:hypothetical protein
MFTFERGNGIEFTEIRQKGRRMDLRARLVEIKVCHCSGGLHAHFFAVHWFPVETLRYAVIFPGFFARAAREYTTFSDC